jgi:hypothetical protein
MRRRVRADEPRASHTHHRRRASGPDHVPDSSEGADRARHVV